MQLQLKAPELEKFISEQVKAGYYPSPEAAMEAAVAQMKVDHECVLTDEDLKAIEESDGQIERGEAVDFDAFADEMRKKYCR